MQGQYPVYFGTYQGEILRVSEDSGADAAALVKYDVLVTFTNGSKQELSGVQCASMFGGIGNTFQHRLLGSDETQAFDINDYFSDDAHRSTTGARVLIVFLAGHIQFPVIVGFLNHPKGVRFLKDHENLDPQAWLVFQGMSFIINGDGEFDVVHRGPPTVDYVKGDALSGALSSVTGALSAVEGTPDPTAIPDNPALTPDDSSVTFRLKFLKDGGFRLNDSAGQMIEMDQSKSRIYISNNDLKSTDGGDSMGPSVATNNTDAEYILWDSDNQRIIINARSKLTLYSFGDLHMVAEGDSDRHILGDEKLKIDGDRTDTYGGSWDFTVNSDYSATVSGDTSFSVSGDFSVQSDGDSKIDATGDFKGNGANISLAAESNFEAKSGGASLTMNAAGQIALKGNQGEVLALIAQILQAILALTVPTSPGGGPSGPPINSADFVQLQTKFQTMAG